jgi:mono/diheme cytochrome c family protein
MEESPMKTRTHVSAWALIAIAGAAPAIGGAASANEPAAAGKNEHGLAVVANPYLGNADAIAQGKDLFVSKACSGCHGAGGGGGMGPPVINSTWIYGDDDTTLFNLIKLGSVGLRAKGYTRTGTEGVVGDMPGFGNNLSDDEILEILAFIHSKASSASP